MIEEGAQVGQDVTIGPFCVVGPNAVLEDRVTLGSHVVVEGHTTLREEAHLSNFVAVGQAPQHTGYKGEPTRVDIGKGAQIREFATIHRGTEMGGGLTYVGPECMLMAYTHVAHDCRLGEKVVMANGANLGGHVEVQEQAIIGGLTAIHQFARIGRNAIIGGASAVSMDVVPFASAAGNRAKITGVNVIGLRRNGFSEEVIRAIRKAHRTVFRANLRLEQAVEGLESEFPGSPEVQCILEFIQTSQRGICR